MGQPVGSKADGEPVGSKINNPEPLDSTGQPVGSKADNPTEARLSQPAKDAKDKESTGG